MQEAHDEASAWRRQAHESSLKVAAFDRILDKIKRAAQGRTLRSSSSRNDYADVGMSPRVRCDPYETGGDP